MHAISSYHGNRHTNKQTQPQTHRQDRLQYTVPQLACSVMTSENNITEVNNILNYKYLYEKFSQLISLSECRVYSVTSLYLYITLPKQGDGNDVLRQKLLVNC